MIPLRTLTIAALLMLAIACGSDAVPATNIPATATPTVAPNDGLDADENR